ncbi:PadR family transcriptional regulator [Catenuloplanes atrovinosus]|uniref:DNA-binding PadR family transcriptional regulator n=1 Tax=Catenuloplanes atrovinosus TaxID=137266 RepID=A0AAE4C708_9ACTN|nr:PadR family transcriptional regulator [Catenuloplanes atrovinosus]MDR7273358.1 DNA-binding PadR family transcriptional regulator [Catenuloplanes atrovinosus]
MKGFAREFWGDEGRRRGFGFPPFGPGGPGFGPWGHGGHHGPGGHHGRGRGGRGRNVRAAVLALLAERPMHGYEIIQELEQRTGGIWRPSPGSVYPTLQLLEDEGLIVAETDGGRKRFTLTDTGREAAATAAEQPPWAEYGDEWVSQAQDFRQAAVGIMSALKQVGISGTPEQRQAALDVLNETKRKLYAILAETE